MAQLWIGSLAAYNAGSPKGAWFTPTDYSDGDEFEEAVRKLLPKDEHEELYIADYDGIPKIAVDEYNLDWNYWVELCEFIEDKEDLAEVALIRWHDVYSNGKPDAFDLADVLDDLAYTFDVGTDWHTELATEFADSMGEVPEWVSRYIDYEGMGRDLAQDYSEYEVNGYVYLFNN